MKATCHHCELRIMRLALFASDHPHTTPHAHPPPPPPPPPRVIMPLRGIIYIVCVPGVRTCVIDLEVSVQWVMSQISRFHFSRSPSNHKSNTPIPLSAPLSVGCSLDLILILERFYFVYVENEEIVLANSCCQQGSVLVSSFISCHSLLEK